MNPWLIAAGYIVIALLVGLFLGACRKAGKGPP
jgi:hypothetical protein